MLGQFLELSVWSRDIRASIAFWEALGFAHGTVGDTWSHRYAVLGDGRLVLGLHEYEFDSPSVTWVRPELAQALPALAALGIEFDFAKTGPEEFNEAGFRDPAGQVITLLEARTWSPGLSHAPPARVLGYFREYRYPAPDPGASAAFWERLGLIRDEGAEGPRAIAGGISLAPSDSVTRPQLLFEHPDETVLRKALETRGFRPEPARGGGLALQAPDGLQLRIVPD
jgi:hypothetical protein